MKDNIKAEIYAVTDYGKSWMSTSRRETIERFQRGVINPTNRFINYVIFA